MSINVEIDLAGAEELVQALNRLDSEMQAQVQQRLAEWAETVKIEASRLVSVRTGYLRSTIFARTQQWQAEVGAEAAYAAAVEFGTTRASARPFIQPALQQHLPELERVLLEALDSARTEASV
jgi:HK97 gp10 family phage protein